MNLTRELAAQYVGGQIEIQNHGENYIYRGEIASATVEDTGEHAVFVAMLKWMAQGVGRPLPSRWVSDNLKLTYRANLLIYSVSSISDNRLLLQSSIAGEITILFPPNGSKLDPSKVIGLTID